MFVVGVVQSELAQELNEMHGATPVTQIERIEAPTREIFYEKYVLQNRPVILTGAATNWRALSTWNREYLKKIAGDSVVTVRYDEAGNFHRWYTEPKYRVDRKMLFSEFLDILSANPSERRYYMTEHDLNLISPELVKDVDLRAYQMNLDYPSGPLMFLGQDTCIPNHFHASNEALLLQIQGRKRVWLFSPDQYSLLYAYPWYRATTPYFSRVDLRDPDPVRFPKYLRAKSLEFDLEPGEILFIPVHWWHHTRVSGLQLSLTQFWTAELRCWSFPYPGLHVASRLILNALRRAMAPMKRAVSSFGKSDP